VWRSVYVARLTDKCECVSTQGAPPADVGVRTGAALHTRAWLDGRACVSLPTQQGQVYERREGGVRDGGGRRQQRIISFDATSN
jgi:hypothetical protein